MTIALDLLAPYDFAFFQRGMVAATLAGALCGVLGVFVVLRGMSYIGHGLSHAVFGGAAASAVMSINFFVGAGIWGIISGVLIGRIARRKIIGADAAIGIVTTASFAGGIALLNRYGQARTSIEAGLCGSVLGSVGMALHHKLCHTLGGSFNLPHAEVHTVVLPHALAFNASAAPQAMQDLAQSLGVTDGPLGVYLLAKNNDALVALKDVGMKASDLDLAADLAVTSPYWNPRPFGLPQRDDIRALLQRAFDGIAPGT